MVSNRRLSAKKSAAERARIEKVVHDSIGWALDKDKERLFEITAQDDGFFYLPSGFEKHHHGLHHFQGIVRTGLDEGAFKATDYAIRDLRITLSRSGTVAWYTGYLDDHAEWNGQPIGWNHARWTSVVEKRGDK